MSEPRIESDLAGWSAHRWSAVVADPGSHAVATELRATSAALEKAQLRALQPWRITGVKSLDDFETLGLLRHYGSPGLPIRRIADYLGAGVGTISTRIDRLERHRFIVRNPDRHDRRSHRVQLVAARCGDVDAMYRALLAVEERFFADLSRNKPNRLAALLALN